MKRDQRTKMGVSENQSPNRNLYWENDGASMPPHFPTSPNGDVAENYFSEDCLLMGKAEIFIKIAGISQPTKNGDLMGKMGKGGDLIPSKMNICGSIDRFHQDPGKFTSHSASFAQQFEVVKVETD